MPAIDEQEAMEDQFVIERVEGERIWLEGMDGSEFGPTPLPPAPAITRSAVASPARSVKCMAGEGCWRGVEAE
jgi:hypothetical protein